MLRFTVVVRAFNFILELTLQRLETLQLDEELGSILGAVGSQELTQSDIYTQVLRLG